MIHPFGPSTTLQVRPDPITLKYRRWDINQFWYSWIAVSGRRSWKREKQGVHFWILFIKYIVFFTFRMQIYMNFNFVTLQLFDTTQISMWYHTYLVNLVIKFWKKSFPNTFFGLYFHILCSNLLGNIDFFRITLE